MSDVENRREVARRLFAAEFEDATLSYSEGEEERAPNYVVTPTGARINRLFAVGALTEVEQVNDDIVRGRIADPTGVFVTYAGQYQPDAMGFLDRTTPPCFVSLTGKARTYQPDDSDRIFTSVRPESLNEVDADTRDRWVVAAAEATLERVATMAAALAVDVRGEDLRAALESRGVDAALAQGVALAVDHYEPTEHYLEAVRTMAVQALELVADERETVEPPAVAPDEAGPDELGPLPVVAAASTAPGDTAASVTTVEDVESAEADADAGAETAGVDADAGAETAGVDADTAADAAETDVHTDAVDADTVDADAAGVSAVDTDAADADTVDADTVDADVVAPDTEGTTEAAPTEPNGAESVEAPAPDPDPGSDDVASDTSDASGVDELGDFGTDATESVADAETSGDVESDPGGDLAAESDTGAGAGLDDGEMYELDEEERAEIEAEFGTEFSTGNEVDDPGEADIDVPDVEELESEVDTAESAADTEVATDPDPGAASTSAGVESETEADAAADAGADAPVATGADSDVATDAEVETDSDAGDAEPAAEPTTGDAEPAAEPAADVDLEAAAVSVMGDLDDGDGADREAVVAAVVEEYGVDPDEVEDAIQEALMSGQCYEPAEGSLKAI
ncbi:hypothetical protein DVK02_01155 [Halobellus sp. Atlit-31R]|nr:hypothetical protein DVK02_01155 [Halobellus sp. Atlit-31R]